MNRMSWTATEKSLEAENDQDLCQFEVRCLRDVIGWVLCITVRSRRWREILPGGVSVMAIGGVQQSRDYSDS